MSAARPDTVKDSARALPHVIAIASGKGGVGKTSISVNLGISLAKAGQRVCIFDADTGLANVNILLGLAPQYTLEHVLFGAKTIEEVLLPGPYGLKIIPGANGISECVTLHPRQQMRLTRELARIESEFDYLILDTAAGIADNTLDFASAAHQTIIVITPEPTSLTDAFSLLKLLHRRRQLTNFQIVVNMASSATQARDVFHRFNAAVEKYIGVTPHLLGFLLLDESLRNAVSLQHPVALFPDTDPSSRSFIRLADAIQQVFDEPGLQPQTSFTDFWHRQFREQGSRTTAADAASPRRNPRARDEFGEPGLDDYLAELKARLLVLMEKPDARPEPLAELLESITSGFQQRFKVSPVKAPVVDAPNVVVPPVDPIAAVEAALTSADRDDRRLRQLADRLQPWATVVPTLHVQTAAVVDGVANEMTDEVEAATAAPVRPSPPRVVRVHHYNDQQFGSQSALLELLRRQGESGKSALELIEILR